MKRRVLIGVLGAFGVCVALFACVGDQGTTVVNNDGASGEGSSMGNGSDGSVVGTDSGTGGGDAAAPGVCKLGTSKFGDGCKFGP
jgi:hypothetical protein